MMQKCLATQIGKNVQVYIDDVVITSKKGTTLIEDLKETFDNLDKFCLKLNPTKCSFGVPAGELLGFLVSARGIEANPEKIQAIVTMRKPTKLKEIQQLTGRVATLSRFVARLGEKALPFYALIKQGEKFQWNEEADRAFENLKRTISTPPILVAPKEKELIRKCVEIKTVDHVLPEAYIEKTPFPAKMKEYSVITSVVNKSAKKPIEPEEQIKVEPAVAIVKDLVTENVEDGHIIFCEDASNIVSHPNKSRKASVPVLSVRIGDHCYYGLCDIGASISAIPYELYTEIMHEIGSCELEDIDVVIRLANRETISPIGIVRDVEVLCDCKKEKIVTKFSGESYEFNFSKFTKTPYKADLPNDDFRVEQCASIALAPNNPLQQHLEDSESEVFREERDELDEIFLRQPILKHDLPVEDLGVTPPPKEDPVFDLKPLPDNLKYAYIDDKKTYLVIISAKLSDFEEERCLEARAAFPLSTSEGKKQSENKRMQTNRNTENAIVPPKIGPLLDRRGELNVSYLPSLDGAAIILGDPSVELQQVPGVVINPPCCTYREIWAEQGDRKI
ncbi:hypothetical protein QYE76_052705, partial [Lolium multiflorum]